MKTNKEESQIKVMTLPSLTPSSIFGDWMSPTGMDKGLGRDFTPSKCRGWQSIYFERSGNYNFER